ncbi:MAG: hypothetical protein O7J95_17545 [Planctomycetota bacterium]|nr:hypothetical protein [Planctomycetota bacterium]
MTPPAVTPPAGTPPDEPIRPDGEDAAPEIGQGFSWAGDSREELVQVIDAAFDYRGDVTLSLRSGESITGYVGNRDRRADRPFVVVFPAAGGAPREIGYDDVQGVSFTGKDTASGRSWETWLKKSKTKKETEARGEAVGDISLYPEAPD